MVSVTVTSVTPLHESNYLADTALPCGCHGSLFASQITQQQQYLPHRRNIMYWNIGSA